MRQQLTVGEQFTRGNAPIGRLVDRWFPFVLALNNVGRAIGRGDIYPFVLSPAAVAKLGFVHDLIHCDV